jgi:hypothetical protein
MIEHVIELNTADFSSFERIHQVLNFDSLFHFDTHPFLDCRLPHSNPLILSHPLTPVNTILALFQRFSENNSGTTIAPKLLPDASWLRCGAVGMPQMMTVTTPVDPGRRFQLMAKAVAPMMSAEVRGRVGGVIFNTWRGLATVKIFKSPTNPRSTRQLAARAILTAQSQAWAALTAVQRAAWNTYAAAHVTSDWSSKSLRLTGQNWFVACNARIQICGGTPITDPPATVAPANPTAVVAGYTAGPPKLLTATWTTPSSATLFVALKIQGPKGQGVTPRFEGAYIIASIASNTTHPYTMISGAIPGKYGLWVYVIDKVTGLASEPIYSEVTVAT